MLKDFIDKIRQTRPVGHTLYLDFGSCLIRVDINSAHIKDELARYFHPFVTGPAAEDIHLTVHEDDEVPRFERSFTVKPPGPGKTKIKEEYLDFNDGRVVRKRLTGMVFCFTRRDHLAVGPCMANLNQVVNFINNRFIWFVLCRGSLLGHAAAVTRNGRGLALAGFSGAGKSTLAMHLMSHGCGFVSNDRLMIQPKGNNLAMAGVAKLPRINPGTILNNPDLTGLLSPEDHDRFSTMDTETLWGIEQKYDVPIDTCFGPDKFKLVFRMDGLVILNWGHNGEPARVQVVDPSERKEILPAFMKETGLFFLPYNDCRMPDPTIECYIEMLSRCRVIEISGGVDFQLAIDTCLRFLQTGDV